jgi:hypothetical protein
MHHALTMIDAEKNRLADHELIQWMTSTSRPLTFVSSMTFFVLGFRDVLSYLKRTNPKDIWDHSINIHCEEDSNHWTWFIEDMQKIGVQETLWGNDFSELLNSIWSEDGHASRDMIYGLVHYAKVTSDPFVHLSLIESLEAAFSVFIEALLPQIEKRGWQNDLRYFGSKHHEEESSHALGTWVGETSIDSDLRKVSLSDDQKHKSELMIQDIFAKFQIVFTSWYDQKDKYQGRFTPEVEKTIRPFQTEV